MGSALHNGSIYHKLEYSCHTSILISRCVAQSHIVRGFTYLDTTPLGWRATKPCYAIFAKACLALGKCKQLHQARAAMD